MALPQDQEAAESPEYACKWVLNTLYCVTSIPSPSLLLSCSAPTPKMNLKKARTLKPPSKNALELDRFFRTHPAEKQQKMRPLNLWLQVGLLRGVS